MKKEVLIFLVFAVLPALMLMLLVAGISKAPGQNVSFGLTPDSNLRAPGEARAMETYAAMPQVAPQPAQLAADKVVFAPGGTPVLTIWANGDIDYQANGTVDDDAKAFLQAVADKFPEVCKK